MTHKRTLISKEPGFIKEYKKKLFELVHSGELIKIGIDGLYQLLKKEFSETAKGLTKKFLNQEIKNIIWTPSVLKELKRVIRYRLQLEEFRQQYFSYIPKEMWEKKSKFFKGLSDLRISATFVAGVGRLITDELGPGAEYFELSVNDFKHPFEISADKEWQIPVLNAANIGIIFDPNIEDNPLRRALSDAEKRKAAAVILTNLIDLNLKKTAGVGHIYRAQASGLHVKLEHLPESYRDEARRILEKRPNGEVIFQNIAARFLGILDALWKISHRPQRKGPEYTGKVLYILGYKEEELMFEAANAELRYIQILKENQLETEIRLANRLLAEAEKLEDNREIKRLEKRQEQLSQQLAITILTNVSDEDRNRQRRRIRALFVKKVQEMIPNCEVISQGSAYFKIGDKIVKIHIPKNISTTESQLVNYNYGIEVFMDILSDLTVICHPYVINHRFVGREDSKDGQPVTKFIHQAPMLVDDIFLRDQLRGAIKEVHPIQKCINNPQFRPGVLVLNCANDILNADAFPISKLDRFMATGNFAYPYPKTKYITWFANTDNHFGAPDKRHIWDSENRVHLGTSEAAIEMIRRQGLINSNDIPIHFTAEMDDATQGDLWFKNRYQPDPQLMSAVHIERWLREIGYGIQRAAEKSDNNEVQRLTEELNKISISQVYLKGDDFPFHQMMQVFDRHIEPNADFYSAVLGRFVKSGLAIRGISKINRAMTDTRDIGVHNFPEGNHRINTLEKADLEGDYMAIKLQDKLLQIPKWQKYEKNHPNFMKETIRAPRFGNVTFGWGTIKVPGGFEWGIRVHGSPTRQSSWADILHAHIKSDLFRGDDTYGLMKYVTVVFFGDKHFYAHAATARVFYTMCAAGVHTNLYGSTGGFPPNNTGPCFVSIPADGPEAGPIIVRMLPHDFLQDWFANPKPFDWAKFLPDPV